MEAKRALCELAYTDTSFDQTVIDYLAPKNAVAHPIIALLRSREPSNRRCRTAKFHGQPSAR